MGKWKSWNFPNGQGSYSYLLAFVVTALAVAFRLVNSDWFGDRPVLILFLAPIILSTYRGGLGPGLFATLLAGVSVNFLLLPPKYTLWLKRPDDLFQWSLFMVLGLLVSLLSERLHRLRREALELAHKATDAEARMHENEGRFRQLTESLPQLVWTTSPTGDCDYLSPQWIEYTGVPAEPQLGTGWLEQVHPDDRQHIIDTWHSTSPHGRLFHVEYRLRRHDGVYHWFDTRAVPLFGHDGRIVKWFGASTDVEDSHQIELLIRESEERFRTVVETGPDAIFIQLGGCFAYLNPRALELFGASSQDQLLGQPVVERFHPDCRLSVSARIQQLNEERQAVPLLDEKILRCDGTSVDVEVSAVPFTFRGSQGALVFARDISLRRKTEQQLLLQDSALRASANSVIILSNTGKILWVNPAFTRMTGYSESDALGKGLALTRSAEHNENFYRDVWQSILSGKVWRGEVTSQRKDGTTYEEEMTITPVKDSESHISHFIAIKQDISLRKQAETDRKKLEGQLLQSQKMEAIGRLSGGIAHDFNNILTAIAGNTRVALEDIPATHPLRENILEIDKATTRARDLVRRILTFSRQEESIRKPLEMPTVVADAVKLLRASLPASIEIHTQLPKGLPRVNADATQIHQIIMNLGTNAAHSIGDKAGRLEFSLDTATLDEHQSKLSPDLTPGHYVRLTVTDNGSGMDKTVSDRIFEPFFTTKGIGEGTGLGLSVVHGIMKNHQGGITVYSQPGQGTVFHLYFPVTEAPIETSTPKTRRVATVPGRHVIYVDDEKPLVFVATRILERLGYKVSGFTNPVEALDAFRAQPDQVDVVVSDCTMPGLSGFDLAREVKRLRPECPVVLASGYVRKQDMAVAHEIGVHHFISKPNTIDDLENVLHEVFNPPPT